MLRPGSEAGVDLGAAMISALVSPSPRSAQPAPGLGGLKGRRFNHDQAPSLLWPTVHGEAPAHELSSAGKTRASARRAESTARRELRHRASRDAHPGAFCLYISCGAPDIRAALRLVRAG